MTRIATLALTAALLAACGGGDPGPILYEVRPGPAATAADLP
jgi:hypothetical protein